MNDSIPGYIKFLIAVASTFIVAIIFVTLAFETNPAGMTMIVQSPVSGELKVHTSPGWVWQGFGTVTSYRQVATVSFGTEENQADHGSGQTGPVNVMFNDNGEASVYGNVRFILPSSDEQMIAIHKRHRTYEHLVDTLLTKCTSNVLINTASMFSAEDIYGGGKSEYQRLAQDQLENGRYQTDTADIEITDPFTQEKRRAKKVSIRKNSDGNIIRLENPLAHFGIRVDQFLMHRDFEYKEGILKQMATQREAFQNAVTARANAQRATQDVITAKAEGEAAVTKAEYEKLVEQKREVVDAEKRKMVAITEAEARRKVAELEKEAAEQTKLANIALGEGEATRKRLVMEADGALQQKLEAYQQVNFKYAEALGNYTGNWMPQVVMGGSNSNGSSSSVQNLIDMFMVNTAKQMALDLNMAKMSPAIYTK